MKRVSTGSVVLDSVLDGFPVGSLISVTGPPGAGKTIFAANWIYNGVKRFGERGLYVSFVEGHDSFIENMRGLGLDFEGLEREGRFRFLEMVTLREIGVPAVFEQIVHEIMDMRATMLVIDSFSAVSQVIEKPYDVRILVHTILSKIVRQLGCTTMIIIEKMSAEEIYEPVEFLSDCVIHLYKTWIDGTLLRYLRILKARGTEIRQPTLTFTLKNGFKVFEPLVMGGPPEVKKRFKIVPHGRNYYSMGIRDLDEIVGVMHRPGCYNLLEIERDVALSPEHLLRPIVSNYLNQGGCAVLLPPYGLSASTIFKSLEPLVDKEILNCNLRVVDFKVFSNEAVEPCAILFEGKSIMDDMPRFWNVISDFRDRSDKPIFSVVGFDTLEYVYGRDELLKILGADLAVTRNLGDIRLNIIRPECAIASHLSALADLHMIVRSIHGAVFLQGVKPKTPLLNIELYVDEEGAEVRLTPIL